MHSLRPANQHEQERKSPHAPISDAQHESLLVGHALVSTLRQTDAVEGETVASKNALLFSKELGGNGGVVREEEPDDDAGEARYGALNELMLSA